MKKPQTAAGGSGSSAAATSRDAMLERMVAAVKNAHKAIHVLKEENEKLKEENAELRLRLQERQAQSLLPDELLPDGIAAPCSSVQKSSVPSRKRAKSSASSAIPAFEAPQPLENGGSGGRDEHGAAIGLGASQEVPIRGNLEPGPASRSPAAVQSRKRKPTPSSPPSSLISSQTPSLLAPSFASFSSIPPTTASTAKRRSDTLHAALFSSEQLQSILKMQDPERCRHLLSLLSPSNYRTIARYTMGISIPVAAKTLKTRLAHCIDADSFQQWKASYSAGRPVLPYSCRQSMHLLQKMFLCIGYENATGQGYCHDLLAALVQRIVGDARQRMAHPLQVALSGLSSLQAEDWQRHLDAWTATLSVPVVQSRAQREKIAPGAREKETTTAPAANIPAHHAELAWLLEMDSDEEDRKEEKEIHSSRSGSDEESEEEREGGEDYEESITAPPLPIYEDEDENGDGAEEQEKDLSPSSEDVPAWSEALPDEIADAPSHSGLDLRPLSSLDSSDQAKQAVIFQEIRDCMLLSFVFEVCEQLGYSSLVQRAINDIAWFTVPPVSMGLWLVWREKRPDDEALIGLSGAAVRGIIDAWTGDRDKQGQRASLGLATVLLERCQRLTSWMSSPSIEAACPSSLSIEWNAAWTHATPHSSPGGVLAPWKIVHCIWREGLWQYLDDLYRHSIPVGSSSQPLSTVCGMSGVLSMTQTALRGVRTIGGGETTGDVAPTSHQALLRLDLADYSPSQRASIRTVYAHGEYFRQHWARMSTPPTQSTSSSLSSPYLSLHKVISLMDQSLHPLWSTYLGGGMVTPLAQDSRRHSSGQGNGDASVGVRTGNVLSPVRLSVLLNSKMHVVRDLVQSLSLLWTASLTASTRLSPTRLVGHVQDYFLAYSQATSQTKIRSLLQSPESWLGEGMGSEFCSARWEEVDAAAAVVDAWFENGVGYITQRTKNKKAEPKTSASSRESHRKASMGMDDILEMDEDEDSVELQMEEEKEGEGEKGVERTMWKVHKVMQEVACLLHLFLLEKCVTVWGHSLHGLLLHLAQDFVPQSSIQGKETVTASSDNEEIERSGLRERVACGLEVCRILCSLPSPWSQHYLVFCGQTMRLLIHSLAPFIPRHPHSLFAALPTTLHARIRLHAPLALVINLDRRVDRWWKMLGRCVQWRFSATRVRAVDGQQVSSQADTISDQLVTQTWNTSLNGQFDRRCVQNTVIAMTATERACALSHLLVWMAIASLYDADDQGASSAWKEESSALSPVQLETFSHVRQTLRWYQTLVPEAWRDVFLIFEDDACLTLSSLTSYLSSSSSSPSRSSHYTYTRCISQEISYLLTKLPASVDVCYLGAALPFHSPQFRALSVKTLFLRVNYLWQLHAYLVRGPSVAKIRSYLPINMPVDNFMASLAYNKVIEVVVLKKVWAVQGVQQMRRGDSDIHHSGTTDKSHEAAAKPLASRKRLVPAKAGRRAPLA